MTRKRVRKSHLGIAAIVLVAAAGIAAMLYLGVQAATRFSTTEDAWQRYNDQTRNVSGSLNALQRQLGYGGFIHNFKNFVLRRAPEYLARAETSAQAALAEIGKLDSVLSTDEERGLLAQVRQTIDEYLVKRDRAVAAPEGLGARELDALVRVDDRAALDALKRLQDLNESRSFQQETAARISFDRAMDTLKQGSFVIVLIIAGASGMIILLIQSTRANARLNESLAYIEQLYSESPNALVSADETGRVFMINRQAERLLGYSLEEITGRTVQSLIPEHHGDDRQSLRAKLDLDHSHGLSQDEGLQVHVRRNDGRDIPVHLRIRIANGTDGTFFLLALLDITEIARLHEDLRAAQQSAEAASQAKSRFLTSMSHEIRTPLNGVLGVLQLIDRDQVPPDIARKLAIAKESGLFLLTLINQVLDFARIEAGQITLSKERFSLPAMMDAMESMFRIRAEMKGLSFSCTVAGDNQSFLYGDFDHIRQILFNLIGNAIKFTESGGIDLLARSQTHRDGKGCRITLEVSDTGPGIAAGDIERIFEEFEQTEVGIRQGGGTGLGLNISRRIAEAMGAKLTVESEVSIGTTFRLTVEVEIAENQEVLSGDVADAGLHAMRILVAEDNSVNQMITQAMLERDGHSVTIAGDGAIAVDRVRADPDAYDLILMDVQMPNMDGVQATITIRQIVADGDILPIVGLTANAFQDQKEEYIGAGMQSVLTKPLEFADLRAALGRHMPARLRALPADATDRPAEPDQPKAAHATHVATGSHLDPGILDQLRASMAPDRLSMLKDKARARSRELLTALEESGDDLDEKCLLTHELSGMLGNFGLKSARLRSKQVEQAMRDGAEISAALQELGEEMETSWRLLERELDVSAG